MSADNDTEPMEVDQEEGTVPQQSPPTPSADEGAQAPVTSSQEDEVQVFASVQWLDGYQPQKCNIELNKVLQTWTNTNNKQHKVDINVVNASEDGNAEIKIKPSLALHLLQNLWEQTLTTKDGNKVTIRSVSLTPPPKMETQEPAADSVDLLTSSASASSSSPLPDPQNEEVKLEEQSSSSSSASAPAAAEVTCPLPVSHFLYVSHIYKKEMERIEKESGVKIETEVTVTFKPQSQKGGDPQKALSDFTTLVQKSLAELGPPIKFVDPEQWKETLRIIQKKENKLFVTLSSEEMIVCGPRQSQDIISKTLNTSEKTLRNTSMANSTWSSQDTPLKIDMNIKDPLTAGLTVEEDHWKLLMTSFTGKVDAIKEKFDVDLQISDVGQGKVDVRARYRKPGGHKSMESHAIRALLHLHQKITTSPLGHTPFLGASGFNGSVKNNDKQSEGTSGPVSNGQSEGDNEDDTCPICMDTFTNKKQLKCKHEFCEKCLERAKEVSGSVCPVCKDVFGKIEGDQPEGTMSLRTTTTSLPGFSPYGTIVISYDIPSGTQTKKHPNPGRWFTGAHRTAYLPDNREGRDVLKLLQRAFEQKLIFTVGTSRTTGADNQVTWNDIHHKTNIHGGPQGFGYPDPDYLSRVRDELKAKGVK